MVNFGIFTYDTANKTLVSDPGAYLQKEMGIALRAKQDAATIKAIKTPDDFIKDRSAKIKEMFEVTNGVAGSGRVTSFFNERLAEYNKLELPSETARKMAERSAQRFYEDELDLLEIAMPGYTQSFQTAAVDHNASIAKNDIAGNDFDKKAYKKKVKAKYAKRYNKQD